MSEGLWRRCPEATLIEQFDSFGVPLSGEWWCVCHGYRNDTLVPVAAGAPLVSDWGRAALAVAAVLNRWVGAGIIREGNAAWPVDELLRAACEGPGGLR